MMVYDIPFTMPTWSYYVLHGLEFVIAFIAAIRLLRSDSYRRVGAALLLFLLSPILLLLGKLNLLGANITYWADHLVLVIALLILLFSKKKQKAAADEFSL